MYTSNLALLGIVLCLSVYGCAAFQKHRLPEVDKLPVPAGGNESVKASYSFSSGFDLGKGRREQDQKIRMTLEDEFVSVLKESGYFAMLQPVKNGGIYIEADILNYGSGTAVIIAGVIGGMTLGAIPVWVTDNFKVTVTVTTPEGKRHEYVLDDAITTVIWLPFVFVLPFKTPNKESIDVRKNIYRNLILKMQQDGLLTTTNEARQISLNMCHRYSDRHYQAQIFIKASN